MINIQIATNVRKTDTLLTRTRLAHALRGIAETLEVGDTPTQGLEVTLRAEGGRDGDVSWDLHYGHKF